MSYADQKFIETAKRILDEGEEVPVRAIWPDGTPAKTLKVFDVHTVYDLSKGEFPALTLRPINLKACVDEILWIFQKKSNDIKELNSHIWDQWATSDGKIGLAYGYQIGNRFRPVNVEYMHSDRSCTGEILELDQTDYVIHELIHNPTSRRIITDIYNIDDLSKMGLDPCAFLTQWSVRTDKSGTKYLDMMLTQRSQDFLTANNWNVCQYAALLIFIAKATGYKPGKLIHQIGDCHIYDRHIDMIKEMITREPYEAPKYELNCNKEEPSFYDFTELDIKLIDYKHHDQIKNIPVAE